jgi:hypothetical protein
MDVGMRTVGADSACGGAKGKKPLVGEWGTRKVFIQPICGFIKIC